MKGKRVLKLSRGCTYLFVVAIQLATINVCTTLQIWFYTVIRSENRGMCSMILSNFIGFKMFLPASMEMTLRMTFSTLCTGLQRSDACSYCVGSSPGVCKMEIHTVPSGYTGTGNER